MSDFRFEEYFLGPELYEGLTGNGKIRMEVMDEEEK